MSAKNPFGEGTSEAMNWDAGFEAQSEAECPYEKDMVRDDPDMEKLYSCWMRGFKAKKRRGRPKKQEEAATPANSGAIEEFKTEDLEAELMKRKRAELDKLLKQKEELDKKVARLQVLLGA